MNFKTYKEILLESLQEMRIRDPRLTLRSFAYLIGILPSQLSDVIKGTKGLSSKKAKKIAMNLNFSDLKTEIFIALIEVEHSRSEKIKGYASKRLDEYIIMIKEKGIDKKKLEILSIIRNEDFQGTACDLAAALNEKEDSILKSIRALMLSELVDVYEGKLFLTKINSVIEMMTIESIAKI